MQKPDIHTLYCDMDGCLVLFEEPAVKACNQAIKDNRFPELSAQIERDLGRQYLWLDDLRMEKKDTNPRSVQQLLHKTLANDRAFWASLPWMPDGQELWHAIAHKAHILSKPMGKGSALGKYDWIARNLSIPKHKIALISYDASANKNQYATTDGAPNLLIDDYIKFVDGFQGAGGIVVHHHNAKSTIEQLISLGAI